MKSTRLKNSDFVLCSKYYGFECQPNPFKLIFAVGYLLLLVTKNQILYKYVHHYSIKE